jgi:cell division protein FtsZ
MITRRTGFAARRQSQAQNARKMLERRGEKKMLVKIKVIGVGGGGGNAVRNMLTSEMAGVEFICANTDAQSLGSMPGDVRTIQIGEKLTGGLGAGANPQTGKDAAIESLIGLKESIGDANLLFVTAGMGGGTGTGAAPVVAQVAREMGILTIGVVTRPFLYETTRHSTAEQGIAELRQQVDSLIIIPNDRLRSIAPKNARMIDMFRLADSVLHAAVRGIAELIIKPGYINVDFADLRTIMLESGYAMMGTGRATGEGRALDAVRRAINNPLLDDVSIAGAKSVLVNVTSTQDITLDEYTEATCMVQEAARGERGDARIIAGMAFDESAGDEIRVTVVATGIESSGQSDFASPPVQATPWESRPSRAPEAVALSMPAPGEEKPAPRPRHFVFATDDNLEKPAYIRRDKGASRELLHTPGQSDHHFDPLEGDDLDLPTFIRKQAN